MNGECCFARAGSGCYAHWKAGKWNRARILSCVNLHVPKLKQVSGILTLGPRSTCHAFGHPDPKEGLLCVLCAACLLSHLSPLKNEQGNLRLTGSSPELCSAVSGSSSGRDPSEMTLGYPSCGFLSF